MGFKRRTARCTEAVGAALTYLEGAGAIVGFPVSTGDVRGWE